MTVAQKIIKYLAIALVIFLIIGIISTILSVFYGLSGVLKLKNNDDNTSNLQMDTIVWDSAKVIDLDIDIAHTNLSIKAGEIFKVETNNSNIISKQNGNKVELKEKGYSWFSNNYNYELVIYIPEDIQINNAKISAGAGKIKIESLNVQNLSLELGAGETYIESLNVYEKCNIEGGAGKMDILSGSIKDLDLDMGVGELNLTCALKDKNEINAGVGTLNITLIDSEDNYEISVDKGIGTVKLDGKELKSGAIYGNGENVIEIDGGIGNIFINFLNKI